LLIGGTVALTASLVTSLFPEAFFPTAVTYVCDAAHRDQCTPMFIDLWEPRPWVAVAGIAAIFGSLAMLLPPRFRRSATSG
jgi:hypothetical protein